MNVVCPITILAAWPVVKSAADAKAEEKINKLKYFMNLGMTFSIPIQCDGTRAFRVSDL